MLYPDEHLHQRRLDLQTSELCEPEAATLPLPPSPVPMRTLSEQPSEAKRAKSDEGTDTDGIAAAKAEVAVMMQTIGLRKPRLIEAILTRKERNVNEMTAMTSWI